MIIDQRIFTPPIHIPPKLHEQALLLSFDNQWQIKKAYKEIIGIYDIDHISINIVNHLGEMVIISSNPSIAYNIFQDGSYLYNGTISPTYYEKLDFYTWDQCYDPRFYQATKDSLQTKNGIKNGIVLIHREHGYNLLFSFATKSKSSEMLNYAISENTNFINIGFHCFHLIKNIYNQCCLSNDFYRINTPAKIKRACCLPNLKVIK